MSLENNYKLLETVSDLSQDLDQELLGREIASGKPVVIHLLAGGHGPENEALLRAAGKLSPEHRAYIFETGDFRGRRYVVTQVIPGNSSFRKWVSAITSGTQSGSVGTGGMPNTAALKVPPPPPPPPPPTLSRPEPGEFTRLLQHPLAPQPAPAAPPTAALAPSAPAPGEFTQILQAQKGEKRPTPQPASAPAASAGEGTQTMMTPAWTPPSTPPATPAGPGEFTQLTQGPLPSAAPAPVSPTGPGEFTQLTQAAPLAPAPPAPVVSRPVQPAPVAPPPPPPPSAPPTAPGEFTRLFEAPLSAPPKAQPQKPDTPGVIAVPYQPRVVAVVHSEPPAPAQTPPGAAPLPPLGQSQPGEFTRLFQAPADTPPAPPPARTAPAPAAPPIGQAAPGEFTRLFEPPAANAAAPTGAPGSHDSQPPGEFTRIFETPFASPSGGVPPASQPPRPAPLAKPAAGEFTRMFETPFAQPAPGVSNMPGSTPAPPRPAPPPAHRPGEFTRMFGGPQPGVGTPSGPPMSSSGSSSATGAFSVPVQPPPPSPEQGPGEYTRMFAPPPAPTSPAPASPAPPAHAAGGVLPAGIPGVQFTPPAAHVSPPVMPHVAPVQLGPSMPHAPSAPHMPGVQFSSPVVNVAPPPIHAPKPSMPASKTPSLLPLILVLAVLMLIAVALVLYFALH